MTTDTLATREDTVTIPRAEYERLLRLTTLQPIETAPRDGTTVILFSYYGGADVGAWADGRWFNGLRHIIAAYWLPMPSFDKKTLTDTKKQLKLSTGF
jgi:hypothetical protein